MDDDSKTGNPTTVTTPSDTEIRIEREFDAPRELVWEAYTDPELLTEWLGPRRLKMTVQEMDVRAGGSYRYTHQDEDGSYVFFGEFREVEPPRLLVQTSQWEGNDQPHSVDRLELEELEGDRTLLLATASFASVEARDAILEPAWRRASARATRSSTSCWHAAGANRTRSRCGCRPGPPSARSRD